MRKIIAALLISAAAAFLPIAQSVAQTGPDLNNATVRGKFFMSGGPPPVLTGCAQTAGRPISDLAGTCTTSATSGTIVFGTPRTIAPDCTVTDQTATPVAVYAVTTTQITLTTVTSAHVITWRCTDVSGG